MTLLFLLRADAWPRAMAIREETLTLAFERARGRPSNLELCHWLKEELKLQVSDLVSVGFEYGTLRVHLKLKEDGLAAKLATVAERVFVYAGGARGKVYLSTAGIGFKAVRVRNLPLTVSMNDVCAVLSMYGDVHKADMEVFPRGSCFAGIQTEARIVKMTLREHIPNYRKIAGHEAYVDYEGYIRTCTTCGSSKHLRAGCTEKKNKERKKLTYAGSVTGANGQVTPVVTNHDVTVLVDGRGDPESVVSEGGGRNLEMDVDNKVNEEAEDEREGEKSSLVVQEVNVVNDEKKEDDEDTMGFGLFDGVELVDNTEPKVNDNHSKEATVAPHAAGGKILTSDAARETSERESEQVSKPVKGKYLVDASSLGSPPPPPPTFGNAAAAISKAILTVSESESFKAPTPPLPTVSTSSKHQTSPPVSKLKIPTAFSQKQKVDRDMRTMQRQGVTTMNRSRSSSRSSSRGNSRHASQSPAPARSSTRNSAKRSASKSPQEHRSRSKTRNQGRKKDGKGGK